jgi:hypothetical protein
MTSPSPHTAVRAESARHVSRSALKFMAQALQRKGRTLSEIAEELDCRRETIVQMLYVEVVRDV